MKTIATQQEQSATLLNTPEEITAGISRIEQMGRVCYQSEPKGNPNAFIKMIIARGHESVLEHMSLSFILVTDRAISHQLVRHRLCSYSQESQRYCNYYNKKTDENTIHYIKPATWDTMPTEEREAIVTIVKNAGNTYGELVQSGCKPEAARAILPNCTKTQIGVTANIRQWRAILKLRLDKHADPQFQILANMIVAGIPEEVMFLFQDVIDGVK